MGEKKPADAIIMVHETTLQSWARDAGTFVLFVALIGIGIVANSSAMQWIGAIMAFITTMVRSSGKVERLTVEQARAKLDAIEAASS
ncbi:hypothetical protein LJR009_001632 [Bosea sp. LjRoot9]|uniref:hypothetical protein n=1 Tax=Bosea sp. LjRoot9 TaxID=3342341 RepID=UPI003ECC56E9